METSNFTLSRDGARLGGIQAGSISTSGVYDIAVVGTYDKDPGANNQRLYLDGTRVAQMSDTLLIDLNSAALDIGRHVNGIADPFNGPIDAFRIDLRPAFRRLDCDHLEQHGRSGWVRDDRSRRAGRRGAASARRRRRVVCLMG